MERQPMTLQLKTLNEDGTFEGVASTYGNVDRVRDRIEKGAFASDNGKEVPILWAHKTDEPVGLGTLQETPEGLKLSGKLNLDTTAGREAYSNIKKGIVKALSIGFELIQHAMDGAVRVIKQGRIHEVSLVVFPANPLAVVTAVKEEQEECAAKQLLHYVT